MPVLTQLAEVLVGEGSSALDMFTGTTRVAAGYKRSGLNVTANDIAAYSRVLAQTYIETDADKIDRVQLGEILADLENTPAREGYFTETFCRRARFFQPHNGMKIDAIRDRIESEFASGPWYPILLTALMEAADRVDSTTGQQMAYLKKWAARSFKDLEMRAPELIAGPGQAVQMDANEAARQLGHFDLVYLDPPYNQHRYFTNYHIWETLIRWDAPQAYGVAQKRVDARTEETKSAYNRKREMPLALADLISALDTDTLVLSYNNESWVTFETLYEQVAGHFADAVALGFDYKRYVGAQIGVFNPDGQRVGQAGPARNIEYVFIGGDSAAIERVRRLAQSGKLAVPGSLVDPDKY